MTKLKELCTELHAAKAEFERLSHIGGEDFYAAGRAYHIANLDYMAEVRRHIGTPPSPLPTYNGVPPLSGPHKHERFPPLVSCEEFEQSHANDAMWYLRLIAGIAIGAAMTALVVLAIASNGGIVK
jgi:hypothetical protein